MANPEVKKTPEQLATSLSSFLREAVADKHEMYALEDFSNEVHLVIQKIASFESKRNGATELSAFYSTLDTEFTKLLAALDVNPAATPEMRSDARELVTSLKKLFLLTSSGIIAPETVGVFDSAINGIDNVFVEMMDKSVIRYVKTRNPELEQYKKFFLPDGTEVVSRKSDIVRNSMSHQERGDFTALVINSVRNIKAEVMRPESQSFLNQEDKDFLTGDSFIVDIVSRISGTFDGNTVGSFTDSDPDLKTSINSAIDTITKIIDKAPRSSLAHHLNIFRSMLFTFKHLDRQGLLAAHGVKPDLVPGNEIYINENAALAVSEILEKFGKKLDLIEDAAWQCDSSGGSLAHLSNDQLADIVIDCNEIFIYLSVKKVSIDQLKLDMATNAALLNQIAEVEKYYSQLKIWLEKIRQKTQDELDAKALGAASAAAAEIESLNLLEVEEHKTKYLEIVGKIVSGNDISLSKFNGNGDDKLIDNLKEVRSTLEKFKSKIEKDMLEIKNTRGVHDPEYIELAAKAKEIGDVILFGEARIRFFDIMFKAGYAGFTVDYQALMEGGPGSKDTTVKVPGVAVEGPSFATKHLGSLLFHHEGAEICQELIKIADDWFRTGGPGKDFFAMNEFTAGKTRYENFKKELRAVLEVKFGDRVTDAVFGLGLDLMTFLDIRGIAAQEQYATGSSPTDESIKATLSKLVERYCPQLRYSYVIMGKGRGIFNPALVLGKLPKSVTRIIRAHPKATHIEKEQKVRKLEHQERVAKLWLDWFAPIPDEFIGELDRNGFYQGREETRVNPIPRIGEYYWHDEQTRDKLRDGKDIVTFPALIQTGEQFEKFIKAAIDGFSPSSKEGEAMRIEVASEISKMSEMVSATKPLAQDKEDVDNPGGIDALYVARAYYIFIRQTVLGVVSRIIQEKYKDNLDGKSLSPAAQDEIKQELGLLFMKIRQQLKAGTTMGSYYIKWSDRPAQSVLDYLLERIPAYEEKVTALTYKEEWAGHDFYMVKMADDGTEVRQPNNEKTLAWIKSMGYDAIRLKRNKHMFLELGGRPAYLEEKVHDFRRYIPGFGKGRSVESVYLEHLHDDNKELWGATAFPQDQITAKKAAKDE